jgi:glycosyltransferase involved in cell wall biosynthesis
MVYFGPEKWDGLWRNRHQLMSRFARRNKVLYVEPKAYLQKVRQQLQAGSLRWHDLREEFTQGRVAQLEDNLYIYRSPTYVPVSGRFPLDRVTWYLWKRLLRQTMRDLGFFKPIIWLSRPGMVNLVGGFNEKLVIYHVVDEYLSYLKDDDVEARRRQQVLERQMLKRADLVIVVSENLLRAKRPFNKHTYLVPNGVDYRAYAQAVDSEEPPPPDIAQLPKPVIGYSGLIAARLDLALLQHIATIHPEWSLALVGAIDEKHCAAELARLRRIDNVHFLGTKEIDQVPHYVQAFDVCLIPYRVNEHSENVSPLKLYDYMAAGKSIVTTDFPAANRFGEVIRIAHAREEFTRHIEQALLQNNGDLVSEMRRIAAQNTWEKRVSQLSRIIQSYLEEESRRVGKRE